MSEIVELNKYLPDNISFKIRNIALLRQILQINNNFLRKENLDKALKIVETKEFKYYSSFIVPESRGWKELETKHGIIFYDLLSEKFTNSSNQQVFDNQYGEQVIEFAKDKFIDINFKNIDMNKLDDMLEFAFNHQMKIQNLEFWHDIVVSNLGKRSFDDKSLCAIGLVPKTGIYFEENFIKFAALNGFKDEAILYLCERGNVFFFLRSLTSEDKVKYHKEIKNALIRKLLKMDFSELIYYLYSYKNLLVDFKDDIKAYLKWILDINPKLFKAKIYSFKNNAWKLETSIFFPDELSGYFAKLIISNNE